MNASPQKNAGQPYFEMASTVEKAQERSERVSPLIPLETGTPYLKRDDTFLGWEKPVVVLIDELAGSCGDIFPMMMQRSGRAKLFGEQTMGLGGNVMEVGQLSSSGATLHLTRSLFNVYDPSNNYTLESYVENNGVKPDLHYPLSVEDFRSGYVDYVTAFSKFALKAAK